MTTILTWLAVAVPIVAGLGVALRRSLASQKLHAAELATKRARFARARESLECVAPFRRRPKAAFGRR